MKTMTTTNFTARVGLAVRTEEVVEENEKQLSLKLQTEQWLDDLGISIDKVKALDAKQEALKAELKATTMELNAEDRKLYRLTSGLIDAAAGAMGKSSPQAEMLLRLRSQVHRPSRDEGAAEVQPVERPPS
jgi:hypothetical protein